MVKEIGNEIICICPWLFIWIIWIDAQTELSTQSLHIWQNANKKKVFYGIKRIKRIS